MMKLRAYWSYGLFLLPFFNLRAPHASEIHPAISAAQQGNFICLALLTDIPTLEGERALHEAVVAGHIDCARFLLYCGVKPSNKTYITAKKHHDELLHLDPCKLSLQQLRRTSIYRLLLLVPSVTTE